MKRTAVAYLRIWCLVTVLIACLYAMTWSLVSIESPAIASVATFGCAAIVGWALVDVYRRRCRYKGILGARARKGLAVAESGNPCGRRRVPNLAKGRPRIGR